MRSRCCWAAVTGDGADGWPQAAPYDRIHVTCRITRIPCTWVTQYGVAVSSSEKPTIRITAG